MSCARITCAGLTEILSGPRVRRFSRIFLDSFGLTHKSVFLRVNMGLKGVKSAVT